MRAPTGVGTLAVELGLEKLKEPPYYEVLFGVNSVIDQDLLPDEIIRVRPLDPAGHAYEIVAGVEQYREAVRHGALTVAVIIKELTADEARRYATDEFLRAAASSSARSVVQVLVAAKDNESRGGDWGVDRLTKVLGIKKSTYAHAWSSVSFVCDELRRIDPEAAHLGLAELVALAVRSNFLPAFTDLYTGRMTVNRFYRQVYQASEVGKEKSQQQREAKGRRRLQSEVPRLADGAAAASPTPIPAAARPGQLIAEAIVKLAQAASGNDDEDEQVLDQQLASVLDAHQNLEATIRQVCRRLLKHLNAASGRRPLSKSTTAVQPVQLNDERQLSFDLAAPADRAGVGESRRRREDGVRAA